VIFWLISFRVLATYFFFCNEMGPLRIVVVRRIFYVTFHTVALRYKRRHKLLATSTMKRNNGLQLFTKVKCCYFQDDEGPFARKHGEVFSDHTYLASLFNLFCFFESYFFISFDLVLLLHYGTFMVSCHPMRPSL